jgi:heavy metal translocating P-type ATPase
MLAETVGSEGKTANGAAGGPDDSLLVRLLAGGVMAVFVMAFSLAVSSGYGFEAFQRLEHDIGPAHWLLLVPALPALALLGGPVLRAAARDLRRRRLTLNVLFALGTSSAVGVSALSYVRGTGPVYLETAVMLLALYTLGRTLTARAKGRTAAVLQRLLEVPDATYERLSPDPGSVPAGALRTGDRVRLRAGDVVPADGTVVEGTSFVDASSLTGEAEPRRRERGDALFAGTSVLDGALTLEVTATGEDRRLARVEEGMREALARPPRIAHLTDRIMRWLIPGVVVLALATFAGWYAAAGFEKALYTSLSVVLITCPCALGIAIPLSLVNALGTASRNGVLVRSGRSLLDLADTRAMAFDKTGTLSALASRSVDVVLPDPAPAVAAGTDVPEAASGPAGSADDLLARAAAVESGTRHVLADAIVAEAAARGLEVPPAREVRTHSGRGVEGRVGLQNAASTEERRVAVGNAAMVRHLGAACPPGLARRAEREAADGRTVLYVVENDLVTGLLALQETPAAHAEAAVDALKNGVEGGGLHVRLLSGDRRAASRRLGRQLDIAVDAERGPDEKVNRIAALRRACGPTTMVGDGINDAAALAEADVGIALASGAPLSIEAADVTIYPQDLRLVPALLGLARRTRRVVRQNLAWTFGYNAVGLGLAVAGLLHPLAAVAVMTASSALVTANAYRLRSDDGFPGP